MGPLISADQLETVSSYVNGDAPVAFRGSAPDGPGYWFPPTVLAPVSNDDRPAREEIFGPVACVIPFEDEAEAIRIANDTIYGLSGSVWTRDGAKALRVARAIETGVVSINSNTSVRVSTPFGGFKQSGVGRELGPDALDAYSEVKNVYYATEEELMAGRLEGKVCVITGAASGIGAETARLFAEEGARVVGVDLAEGAEGELALQADVADEDSVREMYAKAAERDGPDRRPLQQRRDQPRRRRLGARDLARGLAAGPGRQPEVGLPLLQARHPPPARGRRRLGDQHRLVRRGDGRGDLADLLHGVEGRRAGALARARRRVRQARRAGQRPLPRARSTRRCSRSCSRRTPRRRRAGWSTCRWAASPRPGRSPRARSSWRATRAPT